MKYLLKTCTLSGINRVRKILSSDYFTCQFLTRNTVFNIYSPVRPYSLKQRRLPVLTLYTKDPCPLCDIAKEEISIHQHRYKFETVDITDQGNESWWDLYKYDIPVFHFEGKFLMKHRANIKLLDKKLTQFENN